VGLLVGDGPSVAPGTLRPGMEVSIRPLAPERWPEAGRLAGRAFWTEDYMAPLADDVFERFAVVQDLYLRMQMSPTTTTLAAFVGDHVAGFACVERGACFFCGLDPTAAPAGGDRTAEVLHGVDLAIRELHADLPPHATIGPVAVEPTLHRRGIGAALVDAAFELAAADGPATVALDCDPRLQSFYESRGFEAIARVTDPWGFEILGLRRDPGGPVP
jgi:GNAT superfamily N-acetyltransferase